MTPAPTSSRATRPTPPASYMSVATYRPPGFRSATIGVRSAIVSKSSSSSGIPTSRAIASRWRTPFVDPPEPATAAIAFSNASRVRICEGRVSSRTTVITISPAARAAAALEGCVAGIPESPRGLIPRKSITIAIVFAVYWPPQAPAPGQATDSRA